MHNYSASYFCITTLARRNWKQQLTTAQITKENIFLLPNMNRQIRQFIDAEDGK